MATSASEGAGKLTPDLNEWFRDRIVHILPDNGESGEKHAEQVARSLAGIAREIRIVNLPGLAAGDDAYEWIRRGGTREQLDELGGAASTFQATGEHNPNQLRFQLIPFDDLRSTKQLFISSRRCSRAEGSSSFGDRQSASPSGSSRR